MPNKSLTIHAGRLGSRWDLEVAAIWKGGAAQLLGRLKDGTYSNANAINSNGVAAGEGDDGDGRPLGWLTSGGKLVNLRLECRKRTRYLERWPEPNRDLDRWRRL